MKESNAKKLAAQLAEEFPNASVSAHASDRYGDADSVWHVRFRWDQIEPSHNNIYSTDELEVIEENNPFFGQTRKFVAAVRRSIGGMIDGTPGRASELTCIVQTLLDSAEDVFKHDCPGNEYRTDCSARIYSNQTVCGSCEYAADIAKKKQTGKACIECGTTFYDWGAGKERGAASVDGLPILCKKCEEVGVTLDAWVINERERLAMAAQEQETEDLSA